MTAVAIYAKFAGLYATGPYTRYSQRIAGLLPAVLDRLGAHPATLLDIACGEGTFAVAMAKAGLAVTTIDLSEDMLARARRRAADDGVSVDFIRADMRSFVLGQQFDLITCWYDSLNYLTSGEDLASAFAAARRALAPGGIFIFDMNTPAGLASIARSRPVEIIQNRPDAFETHVNSFDAGENIATKRIGGLIRLGGVWTEVAEVHRERAYGLNDVRALLASAGLEEVACWGSIGDMTGPLPDAGRVWFVAKPQAI